MTEIMVGGGILAGVALASAQMFKDQKFAQRKVDNEQKLTIYHQGLAKKLNNPANCNATMKAAGITTGGIPAQTFTRLASCTGNCEEKNDTTDLDHRASDVQITPGVDLVGVGTGYVDGTDVWQIASVRNEVARTTSGPVVLKIDYRMNPKLINNQTKIVTKDIVLNARFEGGNFQECVNDQESTINNLQSDFCKTFNFAGINSSGGLSGQMATWDPVTQTCSLGVDKTCPDVGFMIDGISSTGEVNCRRISTPASASTMRQDAPIDACAAGQQATVQFDTASKRFKVVCP